MSDPTNMNYRKQFKTLTTIAGNKKDHTYSVTDFKSLEGSVHQIANLVDKSCQGCVKNENFVPRAIYSQLARGVPVDPVFEYVPDAVRDRREELTGFADWFKKYQASTNSL